MCQEYSYKMHSQTLNTQVPFRPAFGLSSGHLQTILGNSRPRRFSILGAPCVKRVFEPESDVRVVGFCHWQQPENVSRHTVVLVHGLEGSAEASYVLGTASKAFDAGFNVVRLNVRNCGGTEHLTPHLYHSGLTSDLAFVVQELGDDTNRTSSLTLIGFSMGGNQILKLGGEWGHRSAGCHSRAVRSQSTDRSCSLLACYWTTSKSAVRIPISQKPEVKSPPQADALPRPLRCFKSR